MAVKDTIRSKQPVTCMICDTTTIWRNVGEWEEHMAACITIEEGLREEMVAAA